MTYLRELLDDALSGRRTINDRATFDLLRQIAPDKAEQINRLEGEAISRRTMPTITTVERIKHEMEQPQQTTPTPPGSPVTPPIQKLTRADLTDILQKRRAATMTEIEWFLANARDHPLQLTSGEEHDLRAMAARIQAQAIVTSVTRQALNDEFVAQVLGTYRTVYGDLPQSDVARLEKIRAEAERAIATCERHEKERCRCWSSAREQLFDLRRNAGDKTPLGISALAIWNTLESLARNRKIETTAPPTATLSPQAQADISGAPVPNAYNWRYWKAPAYLDHVR